MTEQLTIQSLGRVQIFIDDKPVTGLASNKVIALLIYLAQTGQIHPREALAELFWAFRTQEQSLSNLRVVVSSIRKSLNPYVTITRSNLGMNHSSSYTFDGAIITRAYALLQEVGEITSPQLEQRVASAIEQYQGPFLHGFTVDASPEYEDWVQRERERYEDMTIAMYDALVTYHLGTESYLAARQLAQSLLKLRQGREVTYHHLMRVSALQGEREQALRYFEECRQHLEELGMELASETLQLHDAITNNSLQNASKLQANYADFTGTTDDNLTLYVFVHATEDLPEQSLRNIHSSIQQRSHGRITLKVVSPNYLGELITGDMPPEQAVLTATEQADLYLAIIGKDYDSDLITAFQHATRRGLPRQIYVKADADQNQELAEFLNSDEAQSVTATKYEDDNSLQAVIETAIQHWLYNATRSIPASTSAILLEDRDDLIYQARRFIGRLDTLEQVHDLLDDGQRVLLQGFGGIGKTALAAQIAAERVSASHHGLWLQAGDADFSEWAEALLRPLDDEAFSADDDLDGQVATVRKALRKANIRLVVMDDVWNGTALYHLLRAIPSNTDLIVTARHQYALDAIMQIASLSPQDALELLNFHARLSGQTDSAERLCEQLGYHSFALEVAGKTLKANQWTPDQLLAQIQDAPQELSTPANFSANERRTVSDLIRTSYHMLDYRARAVFLAFGSLFSATATANLIQQLLQETPEHTTTSLTALVNSGLLNEITSANGTFYQMHDLAFSYARANRRLAVREVLKACADFTKSHAREVYMLEYELSNLLGAADLAYEMAEDEVFLRIVRTLVVDGYMDARGHTSALLEQLNRAIDLVRDGDDTYQEIAHFLIGKRGNAYRERGDLENALRCYQEAVDLAAVLGMYDRQVVGLCAISSIYSNTERYVEANLALDTAEDVINSDEVVDKYDADDIKFMRAYYLHERGLFLTFAMGDFVGARESYALEVTLAKELDESRLHCIGLVNLGTAEYMLEQFDSALEHLGEALDVANRNNNLIWRGMAYEALGETYHAMQEYPSAQTQFNEALAAYKASGVVSFLAKVMEYMQTQEEYVIPAEYLTYLDEQQSG